MIMLVDLWWIGTNNESILPKPDSSWIETEWVFSPYER